MNRLVVVLSLRSYKTTTLIVKEDGYSATVKVCYEIMFIPKILLFMGFVIEYSTTIIVEKVGEILPLKNT